MEEFVRLREVLAPTGVYVLFWRREIIYVGKSLNLFSRLSKHYTNMQRQLRGKDRYDNRTGPCILFDDVMVKFCPIDMLDQEEAKLILAHQPKYNTQHKHKKLDLTHIPAFQELLAKARRQPTVMRRFPRRSTSRAVRSYASQVA